MTLRCRFNPKKFSGSIQQFKVEYSIVFIRKVKIMPTLVIKGKITKGYDHWLDAFDGSEEMRNSRYGIKCLYRGHEIDDPDTIHVVLFTPSIETIQQHMQNDAELIAQAGGDPTPEANEMVICSD